MNNAGTFYLVATPIGNLDDITIRATKILLEANFVVCEDTRVTKKLLTHIGSEAHTFSFNAHSGEKVYFEVLRLLLSGSIVCYVSDAGTPGISDPGNELVSFIRKNAPNIKISPVPGASAVTALASVSGMNLRQFVFAGFAPKRKTQKYFQSLLEAKAPFFFFDSSHRVIKNLDIIIALNGGALDCVVGRELTKLHETLYFGSVLEVKNTLTKDNFVKGEFIVAINASRSSIVELI